MFASILRSQYSRLVAKNIILDAFRLHIEGLVTDGIDFSISILLSKISYTFQLAKKDLPSTNKFMAHRTKNFEASQLSNIEPQFQLAKLHEYPFNFELNSNCRNAHNYCFQMV